MNFRSSAIDITTIRTDGGTQVRESLDDEYVAEIAILFTENRQGALPAVVAFRDAAGDIWLADGFHRHAAAIRSDSQSLVTEVREGSLDDAKLYAAGANTRNGMRLNSGDKKRAILLADTTARKAGKAMGVREIARLVGCDVAHASRVLGGEVLTSQHVVDVELQNNKRAALTARVDGELKTDPNRDSKTIARLVGCHEQTVRTRRKELGLNSIDPGHAARAKGVETRKRIQAELEKDPDRTNFDVAKAVGKTTPDTVQQTRAAMGLPLRKRGGVPFSVVAKSAPVTRADDARIGSDDKVVFAHPTASVDDPLLTDAKRAIELLSAEQLDALMRWLHERAVRDFMSAAE